MRKYVVKQDHGVYDSLEGLENAIGLTEEFLGACDNSEGTTFTVEEENGRLLAVVTNRRIVGTFTKQEWGGRKGDDAIWIGEEEFDATDAVLLMEHRELVELEDCAESSDEIGRSHVSWSGPCSVTVVPSILDYFGVTDLEDITPEALTFARNRANPTKPTEELVTLTVKVKIRVHAGTSVTEFIENLDYSVTSNAEITGG